MADKEVTIKVVTETDATSLENLNDELDNTKSKSEESAEALRTAFSEASEEVEQLTQELADIEMGEVDGDYDEVSQQLEDATNRANELSDALSTIDDTGVNNAKSDADELGDGLDNAREKADDLSNSMGLIESTMLMDMANQLGAIGDNAEGMAQEMNTASITVGQLATNVGMAEPKMVSLINYISNKTFPQEEAMAYVNALNQMGVSADRLGDSATNMDRINDATGMGYQKVMQLTQGLQSVGIQADNLPSSFNAIAFAQANVNGGAETMATVLKRQASTINEYGLNVDQLVLIMQALSEKGVQGMKMGSELSKVLKDNNGDIQAIEQSLGLQAGTLANASSETGKYTGKLQELADEEMEHKTFIDELNAGWEDMQLMLSPVLSPLTSFIGLLGSFGQTALAINSLITLAETFGLLKTANLALIPSQIAEGTAGWFSIGWIVVAIALGIALGLALIYLYNHSEQFRNAVNWLGEKLKWLARILVNNIMNAVHQFSNIIQGIPRALEACLQWAYNLVMNHPLVKALIWLGEKAVWAFSAMGLGQQSPGRIVKAMKRELDWTEDAINDSNLPNVTERLGLSVVDSFGNPDLNVSSSQLMNNQVNADEGTGFNGGNVFNVTFEGCTFDKEERVQEVLDILKYYFQWNNETAGRTV